MIRDHKLRLVVGKRHFWCGECWRMVRHRAIFSSEQMFGEELLVQRAAFWCHVGEPQKDYGPRDGARLQLT